MKTQFIVHPDEVRKELIDELVLNKIDCLGIHPIGGKDAYKTLEDLIALLKTPKFRAILDYAKERGIQIEYELHSMGYLMPKSLFCTHPEYFRINEKGERNSDYNFCISNNEAMEIVCKNAVKLATSLYNSSLNFYFWVDDGRNVFCSCEKCKNLTPSNQAMKITNAILGDSKEVMAISTYNKEHDCYFSMPTVVGKQGAEKTYFLEMSNEEHVELSRSVAFLEDVTHKALSKIR